MAQEGQPDALVEAVLEHCRAGGQATQRALIQAIVNKGLLPPGFTMEEARRALIQAICNKRLLPLGFTKEKAQRMLQDGRLDLLLQMIQSKVWLPGA